MLGYWYNNGIGTETDMQKSNLIISKSANLEEKLAKYNLAYLAFMYEFGKGITKDIVNIFCKMQFDC
ncbi:kinase-like domain-containing protein [Rhizophagus clarus]|uniref:Kinase-like domain-containing protein n=1 Tax=Rhizophagus clarus TaxID=94130 RepID=A0A8H3MC38_9GLOM|nr:kinase-like domain-containing protein [Rhizophagus clarus]